MALNKRARDEMRAHCGEIQDDDAVDPREYFADRRTHRDDNKKARQLCRQVAETLDQILTGETGEDVLRCLRVASVVPAPDSSRLMVTLHADCAADEFDRAHIEQRLADRKGRLRCETSAAITRRKTPNLTFVVIGPDGAASGAGKEARP